MHERRFHGDIDRLRSPERISLLEIERVISMSLDGISPATVLDIGTGSGVFAEAFAGKGLTVSGIDANPDMLSVLPRYVPQGIFRQAVAEEIPFPDGSFDLVFFGHVLHETDDPLQALKEAKRVAVQRVVILEWPYRVEQHGPPIEERLTPETIEDVIRKAGFRSIEMTLLQHMILYILNN